MILASDYDGTFHTEEEQTIRNVKAVERWRAAGNEFGLVTGRSYEMASIPAKEYQIPLDFLICTNGSSIFLPDRTLIADTPMKGETLKELLALSSLGQAERLFALSSLGAFVDIRSGGVRSRTWLLQLPAIETEKIPELDRVWQISLAFESNRQAADCAAQVNEAFQGIYTAYDNLDCVDIVAHGISKSQGILDYLDYRAKAGKESRSQVLVIGDGGNDVEMLRDFRGFTVTGGCPAAKEAASEIFQSVEALIDRFL